MAALAKDCWWTDYSRGGLFIHVWRRSDNTWHRVFPRPIPGYVCTRLAVQDGCVDWLYDATK
jgi:hypothetical protein